MPFEVPESWEWCKLIDVCHIFGRIGFRGYTKDDLVANDGAITLSPSNIIEGQMNYDNCTYISWDKYEESPEIQIANGDILLVKTGSSFGKCAYVCNLPQEATINPQFVVLKYILCNPRFLTYILQSGYARRNYDEFVLGTAIPTFTQVVLGDMYIPLPSIQEQQRIVNAIEQWSALIDTLETAKEELHTSIEHTKSKILDLAIHGKLVPQDPNDEPAIELLRRINPKFTPCDNAHCLYGFPISWELAKLEDVCEFIRNGVSIRQIKGANGIPITRIETISNGVVEREKMGYADIEDDTYEKYYLQNGDILMSHINSPIHVGKSALYESIDGEKIIHGMNLLCLRMKDGIYPKYMNHLFKSDFFRDKIRPYIKNAVNQASINTRSLGGVYTPIPSHKEQLRIVTKIEELFAVLDEIQKSIEA